MEQGKGFEPSPSAWKAESSPRRTPALNLWRPGGESNTELLFTRELLYHLTNRAKLVAMVGVEPTIFPV
jgi:hypothetical protein